MFFFVLSIGIKEAKIDNYNRKVNKTSIHQEMSFQAKLCSFLGLPYKQAAEEPMLPSSSSLYREVREDFLKTKHLIDVVLGDGNCFFFELLLKSYWETSPITVLYVPY